VPSALTQIKDNPGLVRHAAAWRKRPNASQLAAEASPERTMVMRLARLFPVLVLFSLFAIPFSAQADERHALDPRVGLNAFAALVDQQLDSIRSGLRILAATEDVASGDWDRIKGPLAQFANDKPTNAAVWFVRPDGSYFTIQMGLTDQNLKDREYFPRLMAGQEVVGNLVISKSTGKRSAVVAAPVQKDGRVIGALGVSVAMEKVAALIDEKIGFPKQVIFYALDERGQIALHRESNLLFEFATELGSPSLTAAVKAMLSQPEGVVHYKFEGAEREAIFKKSAISGWVYALRW
jgi:methyl-accepting chemotaxis protein